MDYRPMCSTDLRFIAKEELPEQLSKLSGRNILLILSIGSEERLELQSLIGMLKSNNIVTRISSVTSNPAPEDIKDAWDAIGSEPIDLIIAIGGGSAIDLAKAIAAFYTVDTPSLSVEEITADLLQRSYRKRTRFPDILALPTTAGTGSELTSWATIWDKRNNVKYSVDHPDLKPKFAYIVPEFTSTAPKDLTLSTGLDALSHAMEAYWSRHTTPLVQELALRAIQIILDKLPSLLSTPDSLSLREDLCKASVLSALAFSHTRTTACHSISYPLTMLFGIPHGIAVAMTLGEVGKRNSGHFSRDREFYQLFEPFGGIQGWLDQVSKDIFRLRLSAFGIRKEDINLIISRAFTAGRMDNNPVLLSEDDVKEILLSLI